MEIRISGKNENLQIMKENISVIELLEMKNVEMPEMVSVELNGEIIPRGNFESTLIKEGDQVEFLYFMGGGSK